MAKGKRKNKQQFQAMQGLAALQLLSVRQLKLPARLMRVASAAVGVVALGTLSAVLIYHGQAGRYVAHSAPRVPALYAVADTLTSRPTATLVGTPGMLKVLHPTLGANRKTFELSSCPAANDRVTKQLQSRSLAVLVTIVNTPGPRQCTLAQIVAAYGRPNASTTLTGTLEQPREVLLYYDKGPGQSGPLKPISSPQAPATVVPTTLATLPAATCSGKTLLSVVAHEDDDLLFMSPDHLHALHNGQCLRTVYLTAGDDGLRSTYWLGRQKGVEAAYDSMAGHGAQLWIERYITVTSHEYIKMASPRGNPNITLIFVNLPDGNVPGGGFLRTRYQSLAKLNSGEIGTMTTVESQSSYSKPDLTTLLVRLMQYYHPDEIDTQTPVQSSAVATDHSDHVTTGQFAAAAYTQYGQPVALKYYTGYPISLLPPNVSGQDYTDKNAAFSAYIPHDSQVCLNPADCSPTGPYASWMVRQYTYTPGDPLITGPVTPAAPTAPADSASSGLPNGSSGPAN